MDRAETDVLVVGGGVTGCAAAYYLAQAGADVTLVERYDLNTQASGRNAGGLHGQIQHEPFLELGEGWAREFGPTLALMRDAIELWRGLPEEIGADLQRVAPYVSDRMAGGVLCEVEGKANPLLAAPALARAAVDHGARLSLRTA